MKILLVPAKENWHLNIWQLQSLGMGQLFVLFQTNVWETWNTRAHIWNHTTANLYADDAAEPIVTKLNSELMLPAQPIHLTK